MGNGFLLALLVLITYRATWLVTRDSFPPIRRVRELIKAKAVDTGIKVEVDDNGDAFDGGGYEELRGPWANVAELSTCPWCVSLWFSAAAVFGSMPWVDYEYPVLWWGAVAGAVPILATVVEKLKE